MGLELAQREDGSFGVRMLGGGEKKDPIIPTTYDMLQFVQDTELYERIRAVQEDCIQKSDEKVFVAQQALDRLDALCQQLDEDMADMERIVESSGGSYSSQSLKVANPDDLAAAQVTPGSEWILSKVIHHDPQTGMFKLADEDVESDKTFTLPETQVVVLTMIERLRAGDRIFAVYPDTTSFYEATVVQAPRKTNANPYVMVTFVDDSDEQGITHEKFVPLKHTMLPPYDA